MCNTHPVTQPYASCTVKYIEVPAKQSRGSAAPELQPYFTYAAILSFVPKTRYKSGHMVNMGIWSILAHGFLVVETENSRSRAFSIVRENKTNRNDLLLSQFRGANFDHRDQQRSF